MSKRYSAAEVAIKILQKTEELTKSAMAGLKSTTVAPVPGVLSPTDSNTGSPTKVGSQSVVKAPKAKKMGQATDKPSVFFGKAEEMKNIKKSSIENLRSFLDKQRSKR
jgi:hypothetical protein